MKKLLLSAVVAAWGLGSAWADETVVTTLFSNGTQNVTWENTMTFDAEKFADVKVGDYIYITFSETTDVIELKSGAQCLPGSIFKELGEGTADMKCYITQDGLKALQTEGLELCGANFTVLGVSVCNDGFVMPEGAIWGGYFWIDGWNTMELWKTAFANYKGQRYLDINLAPDNTNSTYFMKVLTKWDPETVVASNDDIEKTAAVATIDLGDVDLTEMLENVNALMVQGNPEGGNPFNIVSLVLRDDNSEGEGPGNNPYPTPDTNPSIENLVSTLYNGEPANVTWQTPLNLEASLLNDVEVGDYIYITFSNTTDVIELKAAGVWVPGTIFTRLGEGTPDYKYYVTEAGLAAMQEYGLQITGKSFTVTGVYVCNDGFVMPEGAVWGGYYWIDNGWNTMEIFKTAFAEYDGEKYLDIYLSDDNDGTDYELKVLTNWEPETDIATNDEITHTTTMATVDLSDIDLSEWLEDVNALMIQGHVPDGGTPFNITAVVLRDEKPDDGTSIITVLNSSDRVNVYNLQGQLVKSNVAKSELVNLPKGVYILKGENGTQKVVR